MLNFRNCFICGHSFDTFDYEEKDENKLFHTNSGARNEIVFYLLSHFLKLTLIIVILLVLKKERK